MMLDDESSRKLLTDCVAVVAVVVGVTRSRRNMPWSSMIGTVKVGSTIKWWFTNRFGPSVNGNIYTQNEECDRVHVVFWFLLVLSPTSSSVTTSQLKKLVEVVATN